MRRSQKVISTRGLLFSALTLVDIRYTGFSHSATLFIGVVTILYATTSLTLAPLVFLPSSPVSLTSAINLRASSFNDRWASDSILVFCMG